MNTPKAVPHLIAALAVMSLAACSDSNDAPAEQSVQINFVAQVSGQPFTCGNTYSGVGSGAHDYKATDNRMYIHDVHVHDANGDAIEITLDQDGQWQVDDVAMLDFENSDDSADCNGTPETNMMVLGTVDSSVDLTNTEMCFEVGLPFDKNHLDVSDAATPSPLNTVDMMWAWKVGRKYLRIDGVGDPAGTANPFNLHLGAQGCSSSGASVAPTTQCNFPNTFEVCMDNFNTTTDTVVVDVAGVLAGNDVSMNIGTGMGDRPGCQSFVGDEDCIEIFPRLELDYTAYGMVAGSASVGLDQKLFSKQ